MLLLPPNFSPVLITKRNRKLEIHNAKQLLFVLNTKHNRKKYGLAPNFL